MSWAQWQGETLPTTKNDAKLDVTVAAGDVCGPRQSWRFSFGVYLPMPEPRPNALLYQRVLSAEIDHMGIELKDWRELSGLTIRSTPEWVARAQVCGPYGCLVDPVMDVRHDKMSPETGEYLLCEGGKTLEYELRFGRLDGLYLPCELEAWAVLPQDEFERTEPETAEELGRFAVGEPVLRGMARVAFTGGCVEMERCGEDPVPLALKRLRQELGPVEVVSTSMGWNVRYPNAFVHEPVKEPGWRSTVCFKTGA